MSELIKQLNTYAMMIQAMHEDNQDATQYYKSMQQVLKLIKEYNNNSENVVHLVTPQQQKAA